MAGEAGTTIQYNPTAVVKMQGAEPSQGIHMSAKHLMVAVFYVVGVLQVRQQGTLIDNPLVDDAEGDER